MTTKQFFRWLQVKHSDTYGPARLESTKKLLQANDLLPKYNDRLEADQAALFIVTAILAPSFRLSRDGDEFLQVLKKIIASKENNIYSLLKLALTDYDFLRNIDQLVIDLSSGNVMIYNRDGKTEQVFTTQFEYQKHGLKSFAILDREHLLDIMIHIQQNEDEGKLIGKEPEVRAEIEINN